MKEIRARLKRERNFEGHIFNDLVVPNFLGLKEPNSFDILQADVKTDVSSSEGLENFQEFGTNNQSDIKSTFCIGNHNTEQT